VIFGGGKTMLKNLLLCTVLCFFVLSLSALSLAETMVTKEVCLSAVGMNWKTTEEARNYLLSVAKREAVQELFGEFIRSMTQVENFKLVKDDILSVSSGFIRIKGVPEFYSGTGFAESCVRINAYVTDEDLARFKPRSVKKKVCIADPRLSTGEIRKMAEKQARVQAVRDFEPRLEKVDDDIVLSLLHEGNIESAGFIPETTTYCVVASGTVYPIEIMAAMERSLPEQKANLQEAGLVLKPTASESMPRDLGWMTVKLSPEKQNLFRVYAGDTIYYFAEKGFWVEYEDGNKYFNNPSYNGQMMEFSITSAKEKGEIVRAWSDEPLQLKFRVKNKE
jgi:hypothetical protein